MCEEVKHILPKQHLTRTDYVNDVLAALIPLGFEVCVCFCVCLCAHRLPHSKGAPFRIQTHHCNDGSKISTIAKTKKHKLPQFVHVYTIKIGASDVSPPPSSFFLFHHLSFPELMSSSVIILGPCSVLADFPAGRYKLIEGNQRLSIPLACICLHPACFQHSCYWRPLIAILNCCRHSCYLADSFIVYMQIEVGYEQAQQSPLMVNKQSEGCARKR